MNVHTTSLCLLLSAALWAAPAHAQQQPVPEAPTAGRSTLGQWSVVSGRVLGVGHWQDVVLKHQAGSYWIHASFARLNQDSFELGPSVRVFLPQGYSLDAQRVSVNLSKVHAYEPVTLSTPLGRVDRVTGS